MGVLTLRGAGAKEALQALVPTDLFRIGPGEACYTVLLNERMAVLFVEGQRMYDLHRFNLVRSTLGGDRPTMLPLSRSEILANPNMKEGQATCPKLS